MSEEQIEAIYQHACEGAAESIGHTRENWQQVVYAIRELRRERDEARRLLDEARAQVPVAYMHNKRADVIHTSVKSLLSDFAVNSGPESMLRPIDKSEHYTILLYAAPVPAQPAAVPADVMAALDRMCTPLDDSWLGSQSATAKSDAHSMKVIRDYILGSAVKESLTTEQPAAVPEAVAKDTARLDFLIAERAIVQNHIFTEGARFWVSWPVLGEDQRNLYKSPREAIDAAILSAADTEVKNG